MVLPLFVCGQDALLVSRLLTTSTEVRQYHNVPFLNIMAKQSKCYHKENIQNIIKPYIQILWLFFR